MSRTRPARTLPPLATALLDFTGLPANTTQALGLRAALRPLTEQLRGKEPVLFYPMREVSAFFHVPLPTVAQVYRELEAEGRITRLRGAHTLLLPKRHQPHTPVRGVVGLPLWETGFCEILSWRIFYRHLEARLRARHYVADAIFFQHEPDADVFQKIVRHQLDYCVWFRPLARHKLLLQQLTDAGTPTATVPEPELTLPGASYRTEWEKAVHRLLAVWTQSGIRTVSLLSPATAVSPLLENMLNRHGLTFSVESGSCQEVRRWVETARHKASNGVIFANDQLAEQFISRYPDAFADLMRRRRVLLKTTLHADATLMRGCRLDYIEFDWPKLATQIAEDIASGALLRLRAPVTFPAKLRLQADAAEFAQMD